MEDFAVVNAMTVDVEDYFHAQAFAQCIDRNSWDSIPCRVEANTHRILDQFARSQVCATFFTLGWVAKRYPGIIRRIVGEGHELASHGYGHQLVHELSPAEFRTDLLLAKDTLEEIGGVRIRGYRAPTFSIGPSNSWAFDMLSDTGHSYSSSVYPIRHDLYGSPESPRFPYRPTNGALVEIPMTTLKLWQRNFPVSGGGYFRLLPYGLYKQAFKRFNVHEKRPGMFYFHPWEVDAEQPRVEGASRLSKFRHYINIDLVPSRLERLLRDFQWSRVDKVFASDLASAAG